MCGNALEWVNSQYYEYPYNGRDGRENLAMTFNRIIRGGSFQEDFPNSGIPYEGHVSASARFSNTQSFNISTLGFRLARDATSFISQP